MDFSEGLERETPATPHAERKAAVLNERERGGGLGSLLASSGSLILGTTSSGGEEDMLEIEEDKEDIRYFPVEITPGATRLHQRVKAASTDRLVEWLTSPKYSGNFSFFLFFSSCLFALGLKSTHLFSCTTDTTFGEAFLLTYRSFMTPSELFTKLQARYPFLSSFRSFLLFFLFLLCAHEFLNLLAQVCSKT